MGLNGPCYEWTNRTFFALNLDERIKSEAIRMVKKLLEAIRTLKKLFAQTG